MLTELLIDFRVNKHHRYISAHGIAKASRKIKAEALPFFHTFIGCDTVLFFNGMGKKKAWKTSKVLSSLSKTFQELANCPDLLSLAMSEVERFVVILYSTSRTSECKFVKEAKISYLSVDYKLNTFPPAQDAFIQHTKGQYINMDRGEGGGGGGGMAPHFLSKFLNNSSFYSLCFNHDQQQI